MLVLPIENVFHGFIWDVNWGKAKEIPRDVIEKMILLGRFAFLQCPKNPNYDRCEELKKESSRYERIGLKVMFVRPEDFKALKKEYNK